jgi:hypothetical protein
MQELFEGLHNSTADSRRVDKMGRWWEGRIGKDADVIHSKQLFWQSPTESDEESGKFLKRQ